MKIPKNKAYAFWGYDKFPFLHCGKVTSIDKGCAYTEDYGNFAFVVDFYMDEKSGSDLQDDLHEMMLEYQQEIAEVRTKHHNILRKRLKKDGLKIPTWVNLK
jgi:hypothetical protein